MRSDLALPIVFTLTALSCGHVGQSPAPSPAVTAAVGAVDSEALERRVHELVNRERRQHGLSSLDWNEQIRPIARGHSRHMARHDYFDHRAPNGDDVADRYRRDGFGCTIPVGGQRFLTGGENLFQGNVVRTWSVRQGHAPQVSERHSVNSLAHAAVTGWLGSPSHRRNMLNRHWRTQAIGVFIGRDGRVWITQNLC